VREVGYLPELFSTRFEQVIVHHQKVCMFRIVSATRLLIRRTVKYCKLLVQNSSWRGTVTCSKYVKDVFIILYTDQQLHNSLTNYYTAPTCFDTILPSSGSL